jgi:elongation factor P
MALSYTDLKPGTKIVLEGIPYLVLDYSFSKKQRQLATVQTKLKNIKNGKVIERAFRQGDKIHEADIDTEEVMYLYSKGEEYWFCQPKDRGKRFKLDAELVGPAADFLKENSIVKALVFDGAIINIEIPVKVDLKVIEAPAAVRGNTTQGGTKQISLETGAVIAAPLFINEGDVVRVNTQKGEYVERVSKG